MERLLRRRVGHGSLEPPSRLAERLPLTEAENGAGRHSEHVRVPGTVVERPVPYLEVPEAAVLGLPRGGQPAQPALVGHAHRLALHDQVVALGPGVAAGGQHDVRIGREVLRLALLGARAEVQRAVRPHGGQRRHMRPSVRPHRRDPEQLGPGQPCLGLGPVGRGGLWVAVAGVETRPRVVVRHGLSLLVPENRSTGRTGEPENPCGNPYGVWTAPAAGTHRPSRPGARVSVSGYSRASTTLIRQESDASPTGVRREDRMTMPGRRSSTFTRLLRHGFTDPSAAERLLDSAELMPVRSDPVLLEALGATADPDLALLGLVRLLEAQPGPTARRELLDTLIAAKPLRDRLLGVLGASAALADHLARHPSDWQALVTYEPRDLHPGVEEFERGLAEAADPVSLRVAYRRCLLSIAARDVCG